MRKQYHFRKSDKGILAWDVGRLITLSHDLPQIEVPLSEIHELKETFWFDLEGDSPTCIKIAEHAKLINGVDLQFPIILSSNGRVMDGMHRVCRAWMGGLKTIKAVRFDIDPAPDYVDANPKDLPY
jgi:hypothetical protein